MEGSTNISGGIKQAVVGSDTSTTIWASETTSQFFSSNINNWTTSAPPGTRFKIKCDNVTIWASVMWNWGSYTPTVTTDAGLRIVLLRGGSTTVLQSYIFNFTANVPTTASSSYGSILQSTLNVLPEDRLVFQLKYPTGLQTGAGIGVGLYQPGTGQRSGYIIFSQNTMCTTTGI
jgi:hypothetical protein